VVEPVNYTNSSTRSTAAPKIIIQNTNKFRNILQIFCKVHQFVIEEEEQQPQDKKLFFMALDNKILCYKITFMKRSFSSR
jgi:hypothetical protein